MNPDVEKTKHKGPPKWLLADLAHLPEKSEDCRPVRTRSANDQPPVVGRIPEDIIADVMWELRDALGLPQRLFNHSLIGRESYEEARSRRLRELGLTS